MIAGCGGVNMKVTREGAWKARTSAATSVL